MTILLTGQLTLQWGRLEFGNMGNYYIIEPFIQELHKNFPNAEIRTTFQMTEKFFQKFGVTVLPMELYYGFNGRELIDAQREYELILEYERTGEFSEKTPYISEVLKSDFVIDLSGDMWGDNANLAGENRFLVGLYKDRIAQKLRPTFMLAGSPGPFSEEKEKEFAKEVFENFVAVTNREPISKNILEQAGFSTKNVIECACPSFLFQPNSEIDFTTKVRNKMRNQDGPIVGVIVCGWNFKQAPFSKWPRDEEEYLIFAEMCEYMSEEIGVNVLLMSHSNGFPIPPKKFELQYGRDYLVAEELKKIIDTRGIAKNVYLQDEVWDVWSTKEIIGNFDMLISGRVHGAIAGISQCVPTVILDYGHEPKAHKLKGMAQVVQLSEYVVEPTEQTEIRRMLRKCWEHRTEIRKKLEQIIPEVKKQAEKNFQCLGEYLGGK